MFSINYIWYYPLLIFFFSTINVFIQLRTPLKKLQPYRIDINSEWGWGQIIFYLFFWIHWNTPQLILINWVIWRIESYKTGRITIKLILNWILFYLLALLIGCRVIILYILRFVLVWLYKTETKSLDLLRIDLIVYLNSRNRGVRAIYYHKDIKKIVLVEDGLFGDYINNFDCFNKKNLEITNFDCYKITFNFLQTLFYIACFITFLFVFII